MTTSGAPGGAPGGAGPWGPVPDRGDDAAPVRCERCGTGAPSAPPPLGWSAGTERGRRHWVCPGCVRRDLRGIEGRLDPDWW